MGSTAEYWPSARRTAAPCRSWRWVLARFPFKRGDPGGSLTCAPPGSPQTEASASWVFQLEGRKRFQGNPLEKPQEKPAETWAARKGEFLQKVTVFYIPSLCLQPAKGVCERSLFFSAWHHPNSRCCSGGRPWGGAGGRKRPAVLTSLFLMDF